jgi:hypothetical protein
LRPWLLLLASAVIVGVTWARCPGCLDRARQNDTCAWTGDAPFPIDAQNQAHRQHLAQDAQLADDLAGRYADAEHERLYGWHGHGGLIDHRRVVKECYARLTGVIQRNHAVLPEHVEAAAGQRSRAFDLGVWLSFLPLYWLGAGAVNQWFQRRFARGERSVRFIATALGSVAVSFLGVQLGDLWTVSGEIVRLHNDHIGPHRASAPPWDTHLNELFFAGVVLFWIVALLERRGTSESERPPGGVAIPHGIVLR